MPRKRKIEIKEARKVRRRGLKHTETIESAWSLVQKAIMLKEHQNNNSTNDILHEENILSPNIDIQSNVSESNSNGQNNIINHGIVQIKETTDNMYSSLSTQNENIPMPSYDSDVEIIEAVNDESRPSSLIEHIIGPDNVDGRFGGSETDDDDIFIIEPPAKKIKLDPKTDFEMKTTNATTVTTQPLNEETQIMDSNGNIVNHQLYQFNAPNDNFIQSTLDKLKIPFNRKALAFWADVSYTVFTQSSTPATTFDISSVEDSFFKCLSCFFTGKENYCNFIKAGIQSYFYSNYKNFGTIDEIDFLKLDVTCDHFQKLYECNEITNVHFGLICSWLKCRIGVFSAGHGLKKHGNWEESSDPILLMENENSFYKPVLTLS